MIRRKPRWWGLMAFGLAYLAALNPAWGEVNVADPKGAQSAFGLNGGVASATAVTADRGSFVAGAFQLDYGFKELPLYLSGRVLFGDAVTGNDNWRFDHYHQLFEVGLGLQKELGRGVWFGQMTAGALGVYEVATHHQIIRLGDELGRFTNWSMGPSASIETGLRLKLGAGFSSRMSIGPTWTRQKVADTETDIFGVQTHLGLHYEF